MRQNGGVDEPDPEKYLAPEAAKDPHAIFEGVWAVNERYDATLCNPPFHGSAEEAAATTRRKLHKLGKNEVAAKPVQNFGGKTVSYGVKVGRKGLSAAWWQRA